MEEEAAASGGGEGGEGAPSPPPAPPAPPKLKQPVPGVLYLPFIPPGFGPRQARVLLGAHGELGRVFFQPKDGRVRKRRQRPAPPPSSSSSSSSSSFTEAWVEFRDKRAAKRAAALLHGTPMAPRPRSPFHHHLWSLKYLPGFRWPHLSERLSWERRARGQRLRVEVTQAKREAEFYTQRPPQNPPKPRPGTLPNPPTPTPTWGFTQTPTEAEIWKRKPLPPPAAPPRRLLEKVFGGGGGARGEGGGAGRPPPPPQ